MLKHDITQTRLFCVKLCLLKGIHYNFYNRSHMTFLISKYFAIMSRIFKGSFTKNICYLVEFAFEISICRFDLTKCHWMLRGQTPCQPRCNLALEQLFFAKYKGNINDDQICNHELYRFYSEVNIVFSQPYSTLPHLVPSNKILAIKGELALFDPIICVQKEV